MTIESVKSNVTGCTIHRSGKVRGDKIQYEDGIGCCIWYPFKDMEDAGNAWDFDIDDIDDLIALLQHLKTVEPDVYEEEE